jgi:hypothetical protein
MVFIFVKFQKEAFGIEVDLLDKIAVIRSKIHERLGDRAGIPFTLAFCGKPLEDETAPLASANIEKEATVHAGKAVFPLPDILYSFSSCIN